MAAQRAQQSDGGLLSIGQVLALLQNEFNDLTPSKLRFLEEQGLVTPERTPSGYRKFSQNHIDRLRMVLTLQRDHYLPLKVIAGVLDDMDQGITTQIPAPGTEQAANILRPNTVLTREEILKQTGATSQLLAEAIGSGLLPASEIFPRESLKVLASLVSLAKKGITPRHLRSLRVSAERDASLLRQAAQNRSRGSGDLSVQEESLQLAECLDNVRSGVLKHLLLNPST